MEGLRGEALARGVQGVVVAGLRDQLALKMSSCRAQVQIIIPKLNVEIGLGI